MNLLFVGLNTVDLQFFIHGFPESNSKTKAHKNEISAGGPATNAAIIAAVLGSESSLISPIGKHSMARFVFKDISRYGVNLLDPIQDLESKPVFASIITDEINGERTIFSYHPENSYDKILDELHLVNLREYKLALFDGFYPDLAIPIARKMRELGITTILDGGSWKPGLSELLPYIDIAICSNDFTTPNATTKKEIVRCLKEFGVKEMAITRGEKPILYDKRGTLEVIEVPKINVLDSLGAGDFFHGAFCYYYAQCNDFKLALQRASLIAGESCKHHGTRSWLNTIEKVLIDIK